MAFQPVPDTVEVTVVFTQNLENITNTFHAKKGGGYSQADIDTLAAAVDTLVASELLPVMTQDCLYVQTEVRGLATENDITSIDGASSAIGDLTVEGLPNNCTVSIKKASNQTGRSARGRWYMCGMSVNNLDANENQVTQAVLNNMVAAVDGIRAGVLAGAFDPVIVSRFTGGAARSEGVTFPWVSTVGVNRNVDSQRNRLTR